MSSVLALSQQLGELLLQRHWTTATAESCTGGGIAAAITDSAGSSAWFEQGFVTYSNTAKQSLLGVEPELLERFGAVSQAVVEAMALGACRRASANIGLSSSGIAGPGGAVPGKPVGTVWLGWCLEGQVFSECLQFSGDRQAVRQQAVSYSVNKAIELISKTTV